MLPGSPMNWHRPLVNSPIIFGQLVTLAAYAILALLQGSGGLAVNEAITSLSLRSLMITPLSYLLMAIPDTYASVGCLNRIQDFLAWDDQYRIAECKFNAGKSELVERFARWALHFKTKNFCTFTYNCKCFTTNLCYVNAEITIQSP